MMRRVFSHFQSLPQGIVGSGEFFSVHQVGGRMLIVRDFVVDPRDEVARLVREAPGRRIEKLMTNY
jgi:hypothetical protein